MKLREIRDVDLTASVIDKEHSNPAKGEYEFISKKYVGEAGTPPYFFTWERYSPENHYRDVSEAKAKGFTFVQAGVDPYWPESVVPNAEGLYVFGDLVRMKCRLVEEVERRAENAELSRGAGKAKLNAFRASAKNMGVDITDEAMERLSR